MSYFLTSNEVDHSFLVLPDSNAEHYTPFYVYPQSICVYVEPPRPIGLPDFWGVKFAKQPPPPKPAKKPRVKRKKDAGEDGHADDAVENAEDSRRTKQKQQVLLTDVVLGKKDEAKRPLKPVSDMIFEINSDDNGQVPVKTLLAGDSVQLVEVDAVLEAAGKAD